MFLFLLIIFQNSYLISLSLLCVRLCCDKFLLDIKVFSQILQLNGLSPKIKKLNLLYLIQNLKVEIINILWIRYIQNAQ